MRRAAEGGLQAPRAPAWRAHRPPGFALVRLSGHAASAYRPTRTLHAWSLLPGTLLRVPDYQVPVRQPALAPEHVRVITPLERVTVKMSPVVPGPTAWEVNV